MDTFKNKYVINAMQKQNVNIKCTIVCEQCEHKHIITYSSEMLPICY